MTSGGWLFFASAPSAVASAPSAELFCLGQSAGWSGRNQDARPSALSLASVRGRWALQLADGARTQADLRSAAPKSLTRLAETALGVPADGADAKKCGGRRS
jgi:hypothetical protein